VRDLHLAVEQWYGVVYQDSEAYPQVFHQCGFSYQRAERVYKSRPSEADIAAFEQGQFWTVSDLRVAVERWYGVGYQSQDLYRRLLHSRGLSYQRAERVYRSRPSAAAIAQCQAEQKKVTDFLQAQCRVSFDGLNVVLGSMSISRQIGFKASHMILH
jgi:transposase